MWPNMILAAIASLYIRWLTSGGHSMLLLRQIAAFGVVGICATLIHVTLAWALIEQGALNGFLANACGAAAAFTVS